MPVRLVTRIFAQKKNKPLQNRPGATGRCLASISSVAVLCFASVGVCAEKPKVFDRGEYVYRIAGCAACHTDREGKGAALAGGRGLKTPFGTFYTPNITPHRSTGIGGWADAQFLRALKAGIAPDGRNYFPSFPYTSYTNMRREDVLAIKQYLFDRPAVNKLNRDHDIPLYFLRSFVSVWKWLYFRADPEIKIPAKTGDVSVQRGAYIANALAHCGECHTPRNSMGAMDQSRRFAGTKNGPEGDSVPNITPHPRSGIGRWSDQELKDYLKTGMTPDGDFAGGVMAEVIDEGLKYLLPEDLDALVTYLRSVPKIDNQVKKPKANKKKSEWD